MKRISEHHPGDNAWFSADGSNQRRGDFELFHGPVLWDKQCDDDAQNSNCGNTQHNYLKPKVVADKPKYGGH